jgi:hypothetical protein
MSRKQPKSKTLPGLPSSGPDHPVPETRLVVQVIPLDPKTHKDRGGRYFGPGPKLWFYVQEDGDIMGHVRATNRSGAKAEILKIHPTARFIQ